MALIRRDRQPAKDKTHGRSGRRALHDTVARRVRGAH